MRAPFPEADLIDHFHGIDRIVPFLQRIQLYFPYNVYIILPAIDPFFCHYLVFQTYNILYSKPIKSGIFYNVGAGLQP